MRTAQTAILGKPDAAVWRELDGLDLTYCRPNELTEFPALLFRNRCPQILDLGLMLSHEDDQSYFRNACHPGITGSTVGRESAVLVVPRRDGWL
jgi:hypothetical protein